MAANLKTDQQRQGESPTGDTWLATPFCRLRPAPPPTRLLATRSNLEEWRPVLGTASGPAWQGSASLRSPECSGEKTVPKPAAPLLSAPQPSLENV